MVRRLPSAPRPISDLCPHASSSRHIPSAGRRMSSTPCCSGSAATCACTISPRCRRRWAWAAGTCCPCSACPKPPRPRPGASSGWGRTAAPSWPIRCAIWAGAWPAWAVLCSSARRLRSRPCRPWRARWVRRYRGLRRDRRAGRRSPGGRPARRRPAGAVRLARQPAASRRSALARGRAAPGVHHLPAGGGACGHRPGRSAARALAAAASARGASGGASGCGGRSGTGRLAGRAAGPGGLDPRSSFPYGTPACRGGETAALAHWAQYLARRLPHSYKATRNGLPGWIFVQALALAGRGAISPRRAMADLRAFEREHGANDGSTGSGSSCCGATTSASCTCSTAPRSTAPGACRPLRWHRTMPRASSAGARAAPASRWSMPRCASWPPPAT